MGLTFGEEPVPLHADQDGVVRVGKTRVTLDTVAGAIRDGATAEAIVDQYPSVALDEVYRVLGYYLRHHGEVDASIEERRRQAAEVVRENEARFNPMGVRDRLLSRRRATG